ncbi:MAG: hypothetical protein KJ606_10635 [Chloroflexi bacterium]|nr:hypothetical protein [Chloroflexota bacterium]
MEVTRRLVEASKDKAALIEKRLAGILKPVRPRQEFIRSLRQRIQVTNQPAIVRRFPQRQFTFLLIAGIVSSAIVLVMGVRAFFSLLTALGIIQQADRQLKSQRKIAPGRV